MKYVEPWHAVENGAALEHQLHAELPTGHVLEGVAVSALARRQDNDDVLFALQDGSGRVAAVHLTWARNVDTRWPHTEIYETIDSWAEKTSGATRVDAVNHSTLQALVTFPQQLEAFYMAIPAAYRNWAPESWKGIPSEMFTPIGQLCHVRDIEIDGYHQRFQRPLREDNPVLPSIDGYQLAKDRDYANADAREALRAFSAARARTVEIVSGLTPAQLLRTAMFEGFGPVTVQSLIHILCSHDQQHLAGMQWLLAKIEALRTEV